MTLSFCLSLKLTVRPSALPAVETMRESLPPRTHARLKIMRCLHVLEGSFTNELPAGTDWISVTRLRKEMTATAQERVTVEEKIVRINDFYLVIFWLPRARQ